MFLNHVLDCCETLPAHRGVFKILQLSTMEHFAKIANG